MKQQIKNYLKVAAFGLAFTLCLAFLPGFMRHEPRYVVATYTVQADDSLQTIAERFIVLNTATNRRLDEFEDGIRQENYSIVGDGEVKAGEILTIGYWTN